MGVSGWRQGSTSQAFVRGRALGVQFHPEVDDHVIGGWLTRNSLDLSSPGARPGDTHLPDHEVHGSIVRRWLEHKLETLWSLSGDCYHETSPPQID